MPAGLACTTFLVAPLGSIFGGFEIANARKNRKKSPLAFACLGLICNLVWLCAGLVLLLRFDLVRWAFGH